MRTLVSAISPASGVRVVSRASDIAGSSSQSTTLITIDDAAIIEEWQNQGVPVHAVRGDGRIWLRTLTSTPVSPVAGDMWLEDTASGLSFRIFSGAGLLTFNATQQLTATSYSALLAGSPVRIASSGKVCYAEAIAGAGGSYRVEGVCTATVGLADQGITVATSGDTVQLADWSAITGVATLVPGSRYYLSNIPGKLQATVPAAVCAPVGTAIDISRLVLNIQRPVIR